MKLISKYKNIIIGVISAVLVGCSGGGVCNTSAPSGTLSLSLSAPNQYPAHAAFPITAYLTMTNTSNVNANDLFYAIPDSGNHTGVAITVENGVTNQPCLNIPARQSCTFPVIIGANANPGSFTVTATPNGSSSSAAKVLANNTLSLTANIGLTDLQSNDNSGANGISFLYASRIAATSGSNTQITIVGVVNSSNAGAFNTINLTDANGNLLDFQVLSGNSGNGLTNLTYGSIVTFLLTIPESSTSYNFYGQTMKDGTQVNQGTIKNIILLEDATQGILTVQPTAFNLSAAESYTTQTITYTNIGNGIVTNLNITEPDAPITITQNTCASTLAAGDSCTVVITSSAAMGSSGSGTLTANYGDGEGARTVLSQYNYAGANPVFGLSLTGDELDFVADTIDGTATKQVTLTNTGSVNESDFVFDFGGSSYFTLSAGTGNTPCTVINNTVSNILAANDSCSVTITYTNSTIVNGNTLMTVNYKYNGESSATPVTKELSYETVQATANLSFNPTSPYTFNSIIANNIESRVVEFTIVNNGSDSVSGNLTPAISGSSAFSVLPSTGINDCQTKANLGIGGTCTLSVQFGPTAVESSLLTATINISGSSTTGGTINNSLIVNGATRGPVSANPVITDVSFLPSPPPAGGNGYEESQPVSFERSDSTQPFVVITYKNTGNIAATNFTVDNQVVPTSYTWSAFFSTCQNIVTLESNSANSCTMGYQLDRTTAGNKDFPLGELTASWVDENGPVTSNSIQWVIGDNSYSTFYVNVFLPASVTAVLSSESTGTPEITQVNLESSFYVVFSLSGGYQIADTTYTATAPAGFGPTTSASCTVSGNNPTCAVEFTAPAVAADDQQIDFTTSGIAVTPSSAMIDVMAPRSYIFLTKTAPLGDITSADATTTESTGVGRADEICQQDAANVSWIPAGKGASNMKWKAMISAPGQRVAAPVGSQVDWVLKPNTTYYNIMSESMIGTTNDDGVFTFPLTVNYGQSSTVQDNFVYVVNSYPGIQLGYLMAWTGLNSDWTTNSNNCTNWSSFSHLETGTAGLELYYDITPTVTWNVSNQTLSSTNPSNALSCFTSRTTDGSGTILKQTTLICVSQ